MSLNPYETPVAVEESQATSRDPLHWPSVAGLAVAVLGLAMAGVAFAELSEAVGIEGASLELHWGLLLYSGLWFCFGVAGLQAFINVHQRRGRWLVIAWSACIVATCLFAPVGAVLLMRLMKKPVWDSFQS